MANINKIYNYNKNVKREYNNIVLKLIEEMAELTKALLTYETDSEKILEEVADVRITLAQYILLLDEKNAKEDKQFSIPKTSAIVDYKIARTLKRLNLVDTVNKDFVEKVGDNFNKYYRR